MTQSIIPSVHLTHVYELLVETYGAPHNEPDYDPLGGLVGTILSQHTSDINSGRAYPGLFGSQPDVPKAKQWIKSEIQSSVEAA